MTKKECETALSKLWDNTFGTDCITGEDLDKYVDVIDGLIQYVFNPQPYKFEDLQIGMWVYDDKEKLCNLIYETRINCAGEQEIEFQFTMINLDGDEFLCDIFEEGRFFPITKALEYHK